MYEQIENFLLLENSEIIVKSKFTENHIKGVEEKYKILLDHFRVSIFGLFSLNSLKFENFGSEIPDIVQNLKNLKSINFSNCNLIEIPSFIYKMYKLEHLDFSNNKLIQIPRAFLDFANRSWLTTTNFANNNIFHIPKLFEKVRGSFNFDNNPNNPNIVGQKKKYKKKFHVSYEVPTGNGHVGYFNNFYLYDDEPYQNLIQKIHDPIIVSNREVVHSLEGCDYTDLSNFLKNVNVFLKKIDDGVAYKLIEIPTSWYEYHILNFLRKNDDATLLLKNIDECYKIVFDSQIIKNVLTKYNIKNVTTVEAREEFSKIADSVILNMVAKHYIENYYVNAAKIGEADNIKIIRTLTPIGKEYLKRSKMGKIKLFFIENSDLFSSQVFIIFMILVIMLVKIFLF